MKPASKYVKVAGLLFFLLLPAIFVLVFAYSRHTFIILPIYGEKEAVTREENGKSVTDTIYHTIPAWSFINQDSVRVTDQDYQGKIYIADFFFTTCPSICPKMSRQIGRLQWKLKDEAYKDVMFISHTVDPETDSPYVLKKYASEYKANFDRWTFLTGNKRDLYELGVTGYLLSTREDALAPGGFLHSEKFVLVDKKGRIRGFYDGTDINEVDRLADEVKLLLKQEKIEAAQAKK